MTIFRLVVLAIAISALSACISTGAKVSESLQSVSSSDGWIVGTIGAETGGIFERKGSVYNDNKLVFARIDSAGGGNGGGTLTASAGIGFGAGKSFSTGDEYSDTFAIQLPAGTYGFVGAYFWQNRGQAGTSEVRIGMAPPVTFTVKPGETLYLGSLIATCEWPKGFILKSNPGRPYFTAYSRAGRDIPLLRQEHPELPQKVVGWAPPGDSPALRLPQNPSKP